MAVYGLIGTIAILLHNPKALIALDFYAIWHRSTSNKKKGRFGRRLATPSLPFSATMLYLQYSIGAENCQE
jgi:hypothetical protein